jgi:hypothetical protein
VVFAVAVVVAAAAVVAAAFSCHPSPKAEDLLLSLFLLLPVLLFVIPQGSALSLPLPLPALLRPSKTVISTEAIHSTTVNRAAEKSASLPRPHPRLEAFAFSS